MYRVADNRQYGLYGVCSGYVQVMSCDDPRTLPRKVRKTLAFSKAPRYHCWMSWLSVGLYNFCRGHSSLKSVQDRQVQYRSLAMAARLTDHIWTIRE